MAYKYFDYLSNEKKVSMILAKKQKKVANLMIY